MHLEVNICSPLLKKKSRDTGFGPEAASLCEPNNRDHDINKCLHFLVYSIPWMQFHIVHNKIIHSFIHSFSLVSEADWWLIDVCVNG